MDFLFGRFFWGDWGDNSENISIFVIRKEILETEASEYVENA